MAEYQSIFCKSVSTVLTNLLERQNHCLVLTKVQEEVLKEILQNRDVLAALPTGQMS